VGNFQRIDVGSEYGFGALCRRLNRSCISVIDWGGKSHECTENDGYSKIDDGTRLAKCQ
jgi:hypothetical protein